MPKCKAIAYKRGNGYFKQFNFKYIQVDTEETNEFKNFLFDIYLLEL